MREKLDFLSTRQYFLKVQLLTYKQIIAIKKFGRVQLQYEDF